MLLKAKEKSITFLLPISGKRPAGGLKVVYEYANRLAAENWEVNIVYTAFVLFKKQDLKQKTKSIVRYLYYLIGGVNCKKWFSLDNSIKEKLVFTLNHRDVPKTNYYVATAVETAYYLNRYNIPNRNKLYLIQGYENWQQTDSFVKRTYRYGLKNIVISNWLKKIVTESGADCVLIPNGFDFSYFHRTVPIEDKDKYSISMLYHKDTRKGCDIGLKALEIVKKKFPELKAVFFGVPKRPAFLPEWIEYYQCPNKETHNRIYNESAIFIAPSTTEGWGLTVGEAMICGAAIACSNADGFKEMIINKFNGLISPIRNYQTLAENIIKLIEDDSLRFKLAHEGEISIRKFNWEDSYKLFKKVITM